MTPRYIELHITAKALGTQGDPAVLIAVAHVTAIQPVKNGEGTIVYLPDHVSFPVVEKYEAVKALLLDEPSPRPTREQWTYDEPSEDNIGRLWARKDEPYGTRNDQRTQHVAVHSHPEDRMLDQIGFRRAGGPIEWLTRFEFLNLYRKP